MRERKILKITFGKRGDGSYVPRMFMSMKDLKILGVTPEEREIEYIIDDEKKEIIIKKKVN